MTEPANSVCVRFYDPSTNQGYIFKDTMLLNQLTRDALEIAESFDKAFMSEFKVLSREYSLCSALVYIGRARAAAENDAVREECSTILINSLSSLAAALTLLRSGFTIQPGMIIRTCIEALAVVLHVLQYPDEMDRFRSGKLKSTKAISTAGKILPVFGRLYGSFSKKFTHIGEFHWNVNPVKQHDKGDTALLLNLQFISSGIWLAYVTAELMFIDCVESPRYWKEQKSTKQGHSAYSYEPDDEEVEWMERFFNIGEVQLD